MITYNSNGNTFSFLSNEVTIMSEKWKSGLLYIEQSNVRNNSLFSISPAKLGGTCTATYDCDDVADIANSVCNSSVCACPTGYRAASDEGSCLKG